MGYKNRFSFWLWKKKKTTTVS